MSPSELNAAFRLILIAQRRGSQFLNDAESSVGGPGSERRITNVAAAAVNPNDAVNLAQAQALVAALHATIAQQREELTQLKTRRTRSAAAAANEE